MAYSDADIAELVGGHLFAITKKHAFVVRVTRNKKSTDDFLKYKANATASSKCIIKPVISC